MTSTGFISNFNSGLAKYDGSALYGVTTQDISGLIGTSDLALNAGYLANPNSFVLPTPVSGANAGFTMMGWFNPQSAVSGNPTIIDLSCANVAGGHITVELSGGVLYAFYPGGASAPPLNGGQIQPTGWNFFCYAVCCSGGTTLVQTLYVNGVATTRVGGGTYSAYNVAQTFVGYGAPPFQNYLYGKVDDFRYYDRVLSPMEMRVMYQYSYRLSGVPGATTITPVLGTVAYLNASSSAITFSVANTGMFSFIKVARYLNGVVDRTYNVSAATLANGASSASLVPIDGIGSAYTWSDTCFNIANLTNYTYSFTPTVLGSIGAVALLAYKASIGSVYTSGVQGTSMNVNWSGTYTYVTIQRSVSGVMTTLATNYIGSSFADASLNYSTSYTYTVIPYNNLNQAGSSASATTQTSPYVAPGGLYYNAVLTATANLVYYYPMNANAPIGYNYASGSGVSDGSVLSGSAALSTTVSSPLPTFSSSLYIPDGTSFFQSTGITNTSIPGPFTLSFWVYWAGIPDGKRFFELGNSSGFLLNFYPGNGGKGAAAAVTSGYAGTEYTNVFNANGTWKMLCFTSDANGRDVIYYGSSSNFSGNFTTSVVAFPSAATYLAIPGNSTTNATIGGQFSGSFYVADIRLYNKVLSTTELNVLFASNQSSYTANLTALSTYGVTGTVVDLSFVGLYYNVMIQRNVTGNIGTLTTLTTSYTGQFYVDSGLSYSTSYTYTLTPYNNGGGAGTVSTISATTYPSPNLYYNVVSTATANLVFYYPMSLGSVPGYNYATGTGVADGSILSGGAVFTTGVASPFTRIQSALYIPDTASFWQSTGITNTMVSGAFTLSFWMYWSNLQNGRKFIELGNSTSNMMNMYSGNNNTGVATPVNNSGYIVTEYGASFNASGAWKLMVFTSNGTGTATVYYGSASNSFSNTSMTVTFSSAASYLAFPGSNITNPPVGNSLSQACTGGIYISDVRLYNRVLNSTELNTLYNTSNYT